MSDLPPYDGTKLKCSICWRGEVGIPSPQDVEEFTKAYARAAMAPLEARIKELKKANDDLADAAIRPDGMVLVPEARIAELEAENARIWDEAIERCAKMNEDAARIYREYYTGPGEPFGAPPLEEVAKSIRLLKRTHES